jgi:transcriptional regulator with XRE-family HTH domain
MNRQTRRVVTLGLRVSWWREVAGLSRQDLAQLVGCSAGTITHYERDRNEPGMARLAKIAQVTGAGTVVGFLSARIPATYVPLPRVLQPGAGARPRKVVRA